MKRREQVDDAALMADILTGVPRLDGAACVSRWHLFDPADAFEDAAQVEYRHGAAVVLCRECPCLSLFESWVASLPANRRPGGVVAGQFPESGRAAA